MTNTPGPAQPCVLTEVESGILTVTINRPENRNAVDGVCAEALYNAFKQFDQEDTLKVAILRGKGQHFCAGADLKALSGNGTPNPLHQNQELGPMGPSRLRLSKPVIAAIEGYAVAGGIELACWCDLRVMAENATLGVFCRRFGVPLIDGGTFRLPRLIGQSRAMDLVLTGRPVQGPEALEMGLANRLCEPGRALDTAQSLARQIASFPQQCMRNDRLALLEQWGLSEQEALENEFARGTDTIQSGETLGGASAFAEGAGRHGKY